MFFSDQMDHFYNLELDNERWAYIIYNVISPAEVGIREILQVRISILLPPSTGGKYQTHAKAETSAMYISSLVTI